MQALPNFRSSWLLGFALVALWLAGSPGAARAQETPNFEQLSSSWDQAANRAEKLLESAQALDNVLKSSRSQLTLDRVEQQEFIAANEENSDPLKAQLQEIEDNTLEDGVLSPELDARKSALLDEIASVEAPIISARQAYIRTEANIRAINALLRQRFTKDIRARDASPLSPSRFWTAMTSLRDAALVIGDEISTNWGIEAGRKRFWSQLPLSIFAALLAILISLRLPTKLAELAMGKQGNGERLRRILGVALLLVALIAIVPLMHWLIGIALSAGGVFGIYSMSWLKLIADILLGFFAARLLFDLMRLGGDASLPIPKASTLLALGALGAASLDIGWVMLRMGIVLEDWSIEQNAVYHFLIIFFAAPLVISLSAKASFARIFNRIDAGYLDGTIEYLRLFLRIGMVLAIVFSVFGYAAAAVLSFQGVLFSVAVFAAAYWLSLILIRAIDLMIVKQEPAYGSSPAGEGQGALWPVLVSAAIILATLPIIAIIWQVPLEEVREALVAIGNGFAIGEVRISAASVLAFVAAFLLGFFIVKLIQRLLNTIILPRTQIDIGGRTAIISLLGYVGFTLVALAALTAAGLKFSNLAYIAGALSVGIGFGLQNVVSNFVAGIILLVERPIKIGDWIAVSGHEGHVQDIAVRSTKIQTLDRATVIVPNAELVSTSVLNYVHGSKSIRLRVPIGVSYDEDPHRVEALLREVAGELDLALQIPAPDVFFMGFGESSIDFELRFFIRDADDAPKARSQCNFLIFDKFKEHGITIPFPQRDVHIIRGEAL